MLQRCFPPKYPPTTPMIVVGIEEVTLDEPAHERLLAIIISRLVRCCMDTFQSMSLAGVHTGTAVRNPTDEKTPRLHPVGPEPKEFRATSSLETYPHGMATPRLELPIALTSPPGRQYSSGFRYVPLDGEVVQRLA